MKHHQIKKTVVYSLLCILFIAVMFQACKNDTVHNDIQLNDTLHKDSSQTVAAGTFEIFSPVNDALYAIGEKVLFHIEPSGNTNPDSIVIMSGKKRICVITETPWQYEWTAEGLPMGRQQLKAESWEGGKKTGHKSLYIRLKSDIVPKDYTCKIINKYQHGVTDYTQGLVFENGFMYEGTGQLGRSSLQKYRVENHEIEKSFSLPSDVFGEGIIIVGDKIVQLTWDSGIGYVYDKNTFRQLNTFTFQTEGWGITSDGKKLIMSDGSHILHFLDTDVFAKTGQLEVYDNKGPVKKLNELEYIDGMIYANLYDESDQIVVVDPETGKVMSRINAKNIRPEKTPADMEHVLNGIAWDKDKKRLFITGKYWPSIFEVELVEKH